MLCLYTICDLPKRVVFLAQQVLQLKHFPNPPLNPDYHHGLMQDFHQIYLTQNLKVMRQLQMQPKR